jgi:ornithine cyclodeaminase
MSTARVDAVALIDAAQVRALLPMVECIEIMSKALVGISQKSFSIPPRTIMALVDSSGYFGVMPGSLADPPIYGAKLVGVHPANAGTGRAKLQGFVAIFDHNTGRPLALVDGAEVTALRTGATSALATRVLSRPDSGSLGLFGTGVQAGSHLEAICAVRAIAEVRVWGRSIQHAREFVARYTGHWPKLVAVADPKDAAACDIVCTTTAAREPVVRGEWIRPGTHLNLVGAHSPTTREADTALVQRGRVFVDSLEGAFSEAGEILIPLSEKALDRSHVLGDLGAVLHGVLSGRTSMTEVTIFKSLGVVAQDLMAAHAVYQKIAA